MPREGALVVFLTMICANEFLGYIRREAGYWDVGCHVGHKTLLGGVIFDNGACFDV